MDVLRFCCVLGVLLQRTTSGQKPVSGITVTSSSTHKEWGPELAVDGDIRADPDQCDCCAATNDDEEPWFQFDLGQTYTIRRINVIGRDDRAQSLKNMEIRLGDQSSAGTVLTNDTAKVQIFDYVLPNPQSAQYLTLTLRGISQFFVICEIYVFTDCDEKMYGDNCAQACGNCINSAKCDSVDGKCTSCAAGYIGDTCKLECTGNTYGLRCAETCSGHCYNGARCNIVDGGCTSCAAGYTGHTCHAECTGNTYGLACSKRCSGHCLNNARCNVVDGGCTSCAAGYMGYTCHEECQGNTFGLGCSNMCGHCLNDERCDKADGHCTSCAAGYMGDKCHTECTGNTYGLRCAETCSGHCLHDARCNIVDGRCTSCAAGYTGVTCHTECPENTYGLSCSEKCSGHCLYNERCDIVDGRCTVCAAGFMGYTCHEECSSAYYGLNCSQECGKCENDDCNHINGTCPLGCKSGYHGVLCKNRCQVGRYGDSCLSECGNCKSGNNCDSSTGHCDTGCAPGYNGSLCKETCPDGSYGSGCTLQCGKCSGSSSCLKNTGVCQEGCESGLQDELCKVECDDGSYGKECASTCGMCLNTTVCDKRNGSCPLLLCKDGFGGHTCQQAVKKPDDSSNLAALIAGAICGTVVIVIIAVVAVFLIRRRKQKGTAVKRKESFSSNIRPKNEENVPAVHIKTSEVSKVKSKTRDITVKENEGVKEEDSENVYYAFLAKKTDLKLCQLWDYITLKKKDDNLMFYQEYNRLANGLKKPCNVAMKAKNRGKNRYKGLYAYDHTRVPLVIEEDGEVDYINASFIDGFETPKKFIASQGPIDTMVDDFWRMVWQHKCRSIIMLTNIMEKGTEKCILYWPKEDGEEVAHGNITIKLLSTDTKTDYTIRHLEVYKIGEDNKLPVSQFHFKAWPDKSTPDSTWTLVKFWSKVTDYTAQIKDNGPIVVHCSAGIGRTGTFIAIDNAYYRTKNEGTLKMLDVVTSLREQRVNMVQTKDQYVYLHETVADMFHFGTHFIWTNQFEEVYEYLSESDIGSRITRLQTQYNLIVESIADKKSVHTTVEDDNNEYSNIFIHQQPKPVPVDEYRPKSKSLVYVQEVGALILQNHEEKDAFIICKSPGESRMAEFWSLVKEQNVKTIISLSDASLSASKRAQNIGLENKMVQQKFGLSLAEERKTAAFQEKKITLHDSLDGKLTVSHFEYNNWATGGNVPKDTSSMLQLLEAILDRQPRMSGTAPILVYCTNGVKYSGLLCVLLSEVNRINREGGQVNIVQTVKTMKERNDDIVATFDQYQYIHDVILARIMDSTYQNQ